MIATRIRLLAVFFFSLGPTLAPASPCKKLNGLPGAEDIATNTERTIAYISSQERRKGDVEGALFRYDTEHGSDPVKLSLPLGPSTLHPHGISLLENEEGSFLYVINHRESENTIDVFSLEGSSAILVESYSSPLLVSPNDLYVIDNGRFFVTNDLAISKPLWKIPLKKGGLRSGNVLWHDNKGFREIASGIGYANGIVLVDNTLVVAASLERGVHIYDWDGTNAKPQHFIKLRTGVDNIEVSEDGSLWIASHKNWLQFVLHGLHPRYSSPSEIVILENLRENPKRPTIIKQDIPAAGASVALPLGDLMVIGTVFEDYVLICNKE